MVESLTVDSLPYPWPWHGDFDPGKAALIIVRDGEIAPPGRDCAALLCSLVELASGAGLTVIDLASLARWTAPPPFSANLRIERPHIGGFTGTDLDAMLRRRRITDLVFVGFPFELGADCTMRQANDLGYECLAISDCCTGLSADTLSGAMYSIQMSGGIFGAVAAAASSFDLLAQAKTRAANAAKGA